MHIAYADAEAYAQWPGKRLPTEAEWEFAARGGLAGESVFASVIDRKVTLVRVGHPFAIRPRRIAPHKGLAGIAPVAQYLPNRCGLYEIAGNVWQWTSDWYRPDYYQERAAAGRVARNPQGPDFSFDPGEPNQAMKVHRGGSFLCTDQ